MSSYTRDGAEVPQIDAERPEKAPYDLLTPTQRHVYALLSGRILDGLCRRDFALHDIYEVSNRISEIEQRLGITIERDRCHVHQHRNRIIRYRL
jgi:hypothetical protein